MGLRIVTVAIGLALLVTGCGSDEPPQVQAGARTGVDPTSAVQGGPTVSANCSEAAEEAGGSAVPSANGSGLCAIVDVEERHEPSTEVVRFLLDGEPVDTIGIGPCRIPDAFAVPSQGTRPSDDGTGFFVVGQNKAAPKDLEAALQANVANLTRVEVEAFPALETSVFYVFVRSDDLKGLLEQTSKAVESVIPPVEVPECAL